MSKKYSSLICSECAKSVHSKIPEGHIFSFYMYICDVCNRWKSVTDIRNYGYPKVESKNDIELIRHEISKAKRKFIKDNDHASVLEIESIMIDFEERCKAALH